MSDTGLEGLQVGELKGVPESVSLELSRWLLSREIRLELPPLELRFNSAVLCAKKKKQTDTRQLIFKHVFKVFVPTTAGRQPHPLLPLHQFRRKVLMELLLLHMCCFDLHPVLQHVDVVCLSVHCGEC